MNCFYFHLFIVQFHIFMINRRLFGNTIVIMALTHITQTIMISILATETYYLMVPFSKRININVPLPQRHI